MSIPEECLLLGAGDATVNAATPDPGVAGHAAGVVSICVASSRVGVSTAARVTRVRSAESRCRRAA